MLKKIQSLTIATKLVISFSFVIMIFLGVVGYSRMVFSQADSMYRYKFNYLVAREMYLLEFHQEFTEIRRLFKSSFYNPIWLETADLPTWHRYEDDITNSYLQMHKFSAMYIESAGTDPYLSVQEYTQKIYTMQEIMDYVSVLYDLFRDNFFIGGNDSHYIGDVLDYTYMLENNLRELRRLDREVAAQILLYVDNTLRTNEFITILILAFAVALTSIFAFYTIKSFTGRIKLITENVSHVKRGDFSASLKKGKGDEISRLIAGMVGIFEELIEEIHLVSAENDAGNTEALIDLNKFEGGYKNAAIAINSLINNIKESNRGIIESMAREQEATERMQLMFDATPLVIIYWNKDHECIDCNQAAALYYGLDSKEKLNQHFHDYKLEFQPGGSPTTEFWHYHLDKAFEEGYTKFEYAVKKGRRKDDEIAFFDVIGQRMKFMGDFVVVTYASDVTTLKEMLKERERIVIAEANSQAKSRFLARMSHEIRTPITAVLGIAEIQLQKPNLDPGVEEAFNKIHSSSGTLIGIVNDILDLSKIEAGKMSLAYEKYDVPQLISDVVQLHTVYLGSKQFKFSVNIDENLPKLLIGDELRIKQALTNTLSNAFKYTTVGQVTFTIECQAECQTECQNDPGKDYINKDYINLVATIKDTGRGMTQDQLDALFKEYTRFHELENRFIEGSGLGMPIVYSLVQMMGATINVESQIHIGTTVTINIPQQVVSKEIIGPELAKNLLEVGIHTKKLPFTPEPMPYGSVLVVDDVETNRYVARGLLGLYEINVESVNSGRLAIEKIKEGKVYDIIFMDHMMPDLNGIEATQILRSMGYDYPIVALTANALVGQAEEFFKKGFDGFIAKPIQTSQLNSILVKFIKEKRLASDLPLDVHVEVPEIVEFAEFTGGHAADHEAGHEVGHEVDGYDDYYDRPEVKEMMRQDFAESQKDAMQEIHQAINAGDYKSAELLVHTLKSLARYMKEEPLENAAAEAEDAFALKNDISKSDLMQTLEREYTTVMEKILVAGTNS